MKEFDIIEFHPIDKGEYNSDSYNVTDGEANGDYVGLDKKAL